MTDIDTNTPEPLTLSPAPSMMLEDRYADALDAARAKLGKPAPALEVYISRQVGDKWQLCASMPADDLDIGRVGQQWGGGVYRFTIRASGHRGSVAMVQGDIAHPLSTRTVAATPATAAAPHYGGSIIADELAHARGERNMFLEKLLSMMDRGGAASTPAPQPQPTPEQQIQSLAATLKAMREIDPERAPRGSIATDVIGGIMQIGQMAMPAFERLIDRIGQRQPQVVYVPHGASVPHTLPAVPAHAPAPTPQPSTPELKLVRDEAAPVDLASLPLDERMRRITPAIMSPLMVYVSAKEPDPAAYAEMLFDVLDLADLLDMVMADSSSLVSKLTAEMPQLAQHRAKLDAIETELRALYAGDGEANDAAGD